MGVTIQNVTGNTALVTWSKMASCTGGFYSIMYNPNWDKTLSGYTRNHFQKEVRVPAGRSSFVIQNLIPLTTYILCVTCQLSSPSSNQCRTFSTPEKDSGSTSNRKKELAMGIWLTSTVLLLLIAGILVYGCMHIWWRKRRERLESQSSTPEEKGKAWIKNDLCSMEEFNVAQRVQGAWTRNADGVQLTTIIANPLTSEEPTLLTSQSPDFVPMSACQSAVN